jgi:hypothetical protein
MAAPGQVSPGHTASPGVPPPVPTGAAFHAAIDGASAGPFDMAALAAQIRAGKITRKSFVWQKGMANWVAAETVPELQGLFADVPPPIPG